MKLTFKQKLIAAILAIVVTTALVVAFLIVPQFSQISVLNSQQKEIELKIQTDKNTLAQLEELKNGAATTESKLLQIGTEMPDSPQLPTLIIEMQDIANKSGVTITTFTPAQPVADVGGQYNRIAMSVQIVARWDDLLDYLRRINKMTRLLRITNITANPTQSAETTASIGEEKTLTVSLGIDAYSMNDGTLNSAATTNTPGQ